MTVIELLFARPPGEGLSRQSLKIAVSISNYFFHFVKFEISLILFLEGLPLVNDYFERK